MVPIFRNLGLIYLHVLKIIIKLFLVPSEAPTHMEAILLNSTAVHLKWKPPPLYTHNGIIRSYMVS